MEPPQDQIRALMERYGVTAPDGRRVVRDVQAARSKVAHRMRKFRRLASFVPAYQRQEIVRKAAGYRNRPLPPRVTPQHLRQRGASLVAGCLADVAHERVPNIVRFRRGLRYLAAARYLEDERRNLVEL